MEERPVGTEIGCQVRNKDLKAINYTFRLLRYVSNMPRAVILISSTKF